MAPRRLKWAAITVNVALRYLMASSGFWNCAAAGRATAAAAKARESVMSRRIGKLLDGVTGVGIFSGSTVCASPGYAR